LVSRDHSAPRGDIAVTFVKRCSLRATATASNQTTKEPRPEVLQDNSLCFRGPFIMCSSTSVSVGLMRTSGRKWKCATTALQRARMNARNVVQYNLVSLSDFERSLFEPRSLALSQASRFWVLPFDTAAAKAFLLLAGKVLKVYNGCAHAQSCGEACSRIENYRLFTNVTTFLPLQVVGEGDIEPFRGPGDRTPTGHWQKGRGTGKTTV
jgi:hypothetical protein